MRIRVLGACEVETAERKVALRYRQAELVGLLAVRRGQVARATAASLLWPDAEISAARHNLRQTLVALRSSGVTCVASEGESLVLKGVTVDLWELEERLTGDFPPQSVEELLPDIQAEWLTPARAALIRSVVAACLRRGGACVDSDPLTALAYADVALAQDPWLESSRGLRVQALVAAGELARAEVEVATFERELEGGRSRLRDLIEREATDPLLGLPLAKLNPNEQVRLLTALAPALNGRVQPILTKALAESRGIGRDDRARALATLSGLELEQGDVTLAEEHARAAMSSATGAESLSLATLALARALILTNRGDDAERLLNTALDSCTHNDPERRSALLSARAAALARRHALADSERDSRAALALAREAGCARLVAKAHYNLASAALWAGRFDAAQRGAEAGLAELHGADPLEAGGFAFILGRVLEVQGFWSKAGAAYRQGLERMREAGHPTRLAQGLTMAADLDRRRGDFEAAEPTYREAIGLWRALGDRIGLGTALKGLGQSLFARGDLRAAERRLREAVDAYLAGGDPLGGASALLPLARLLLDTDRPAEALPNARRAFERLREMKADASGLTSDETLSHESARQLLEEIQQKLTEAEKPSSL